MIVLTPILRDKYNRKFFDLLVEELEKSFPKGKCNERGQALVLNAYANFFFKQLLAEFEQEIIKSIKKKNK